MANATHNPIKSTKFHNGKNVNKREKRGREISNTLVDADTAFEILTDDGVDFVRGTAAITVTLPKAAENKGRCLKFLTRDAETLTIGQNADSANIDGVDADLATLVGIDDCLELFCTGSEWIIIASSI